jgi:lipid A 3-O-deacylase
VKKFASAFALLIGVLSCLPTYAAASPDYVNAALGGYDFDKNGNRDSVDYRLEYQWGASLLPMVDHSWSNLDHWFQIHPVAGFEGNGNGMTYFNGGLNMDVPVVSRLMFTWGENIGWYGHGDDHQSLGSAFELRSQLELGWRFQNEMRVSGYISHLSNAGIGDHDPGAEVLGAYLRVPVGWLAK